jgi:hypothetical protein
MDREGLPLHFIKTVLLLAKIQNLTKDSFFLDKFNSKIYSFGLSFLELFQGESASVAQYRVLLERHLASIDSLRDVLKEFQYLGIVKDAPLLLEVELSLLDIKLEIYRRKKGSILEDISNDNSSHHEPKVSQKNTEIIRVVTKKNNKLASSKKKILDFIKSYPNTRTKDIVYEFNVLSDRTVKRNLTDLLRAGLVKKRIDNKAVYYYASE